MTPESMKALRTELETANSVLFTGPVDPDGDSFGACMALASAASSFSDGTLHVTGKASYRYDWLPGAQSLIGDTELLDSYDLVIVMDGDRNRLTPGVELFQGRAHGVGRSSSDIEHGRLRCCSLGLGSPSTCEMVYQVSTVGCRLDADMATQLYTGTFLIPGDSNTRTPRWPPIVWRLNLELCPP